MCIRDRSGQARDNPTKAARIIQQPACIPKRIGEGQDTQPCLLYTSDAADERSSVDLGGRRIIKKTKQERTRAGTHDQ